MNIDRKLKDNYPYFIQDKLYGSPLSLTSQFYFCPVPFRMDTYSGCWHDCVYCFANNSNQKFIGDINFSGDKKRHIYVKATKLEYVKKYLDIAFEGKKNTFSNQEAIAIELLQRKVPIHFGGMSDPLQPIEKELHLTYDVLNLFKKYDYPIILSSKAMLLLDEKYIAIIKDYKNLVLQISMIDDRDDVLKILEPNCSSATQRFKIFETYREKFTACRIQPFIIGLTESRIIPFLDKLKDCGVNHVMVEGLKFMSGNKLANIRISDAFKKITGKPYNLEAYFKAIGSKYDGNDLELPTWRKYKYIKIFKEEIAKRGMTFGCADNDLRLLGSSYNCCLGSTEIKGFEAGLKHNIGEAVFKAHAKGIKEFDKSIIEEEWISDGKFRLVMSNEKAMEKFGDDKENQTSNRKVKELFDKAWESGGKNSPCQMCHLKEGCSKNKYKFLNEIELKELLRDKGNQQTL
jgi:DNA repair photolyase